MDNQTPLQKILYFFLTKIIIGILVVAGSVALVQNAGKYLLDKTQMSDELKNAFVGIADISIALAVYILLFRFYEQRQIKELSLATFFKNAFTGFWTGLILQSLMILVIYLAGGYYIIHINPVSFLIPSFITALIAGVVAEIVLRGIVFRLTEEKLGTVIALIISALLFTVAHLGVKGATVLSVLSTVTQAGILVSSVYVYSRSLWLPMFVHFAWDFAEPGIYGGVNPGIKIDQSLFTSKISGSELITGGQFGPGNSIQSIIFCLTTSVILLWLAKRKNHFVSPFWKKKKLFSVV